MGTSKHLFPAGIALLWLGLLVAYGQSLFFPPLNYDDHSYLNLHPLADESLLSGHFWSTLFQNSTVNLWTPLTDLSHQILLRLSSGPAIHHLGNILLHGLNATLWSILLRTTTKNQILALSVGLLFAWHPVTVESVAWISGRKDLLCTFFITLAFFAHNSWTRSKDKNHYAAITLAIIAAIASKPIAFVAPLLLLAFDFWPLHRPEKPLSLLREKAPLLALSLLSVLLTLHFQSQGTQAVADGRSFFERSAGALWALQQSLHSIVWPLQLHLNYQDPGSLSLGWLLIFASLLAIPALLILCFAKRQPALLIGALWYLLALGPTLGFIRAGNHLAADRYCYLPLLGLLIACTSLLKGRPKLLLALTIATALPLLILSTLQVRTWRSVETLSLHALRHQPKNPEAHAQLGRIAHHNGEHQQAVAHLQKALHSQPAHADANLILAHIRFQEQSYQAAYQHFEIASRLRTREASVQERLAASAYGAGNRAKARQHLQEAFKLRQAHDENLKLPEKWQRLFPDEPVPE